MRNDSVESVMVPYGYTLTLYDGDGQSSAYASEVQKGRRLDGQGMMQCVNISLRNKVSSVMYVKDPTYDTPANGVWKEIAAITAGTTSYEYSLSTTSTDSSTTKASMTSTISTEMKEGIVFESAKVSTSYSSSIEAATTSTLALTESVKLTAKCDYVKDAWATSLYQWVT